MSTGLKPWPPATSQRECGAVVQLYLHKPRGGGGEGFVLATTNPVSNPCRSPFAGFAGWLAGSRPLSPEQLSLVPPGRKGACGFHLGWELPLSVPNA